MDHTIVTKPVRDEPEFLRRRKKTVKEDQGEGGRLRCLHSHAKIQDIAGILSSKAVDNLS